MRTKRMIQMVGAHTEGEATRIVVGGVLDLPGASMADKLAYLKANRDLVDFCLFEPRGSAALTAALILPPVSDKADVGFIPLQPLGPIAFSGSTAVSAVTVLLETGMLPLCEPVTTVCLDTAAGLVQTKAFCSNGRVTRVELVAGPAFAESLDYPLEVPGIGVVPVDVAFGGGFFALCDVARFPDLRIAADKADALVSLGLRIRESARANIAVRHPLMPHINTIDFFVFTDSRQEQEGQFWNANVLAPGRLDRSPCGAGSMARLAVLHARGLLAPGQPVVMRSVIGSRFDMCIERECMVENRQAVVPRLSGRAWLYSTEQIFVDADDPYPLGFTVADTWGAVIERPSSTAGGK